MLRSRILALLAILLAALAVVLLQVDQANRRLLMATVARVDAGASADPGARFERYVAFAHRELRNPGYAGLPNGWVRLYYRLNPMHPGAGDVLRWGADYRGPCGSFSNVVVSMLKAAGVPARPLLLLDRSGRSLHTVVEGRVGGRWVVGDPAEGVVFHDRAGRLATSDELAGDPSLVRAEVADVRDYPPQYDYRAVTRFNWRKVPVLLPAVRAVLVAAIGEPRVRRIVRPDLWMHPELAFGTACGVLAVAAAWLAWAARPAPARLAVRGPGTEAVTLTDARGMRRAPRRRAASVPAQAAGTLAGAALQRHQRRGALTRDVEVESER